MENIKDYNDRVLIKTIDSERYGNHIAWKDNLNMSYVSNYTLVVGKERERYIKRNIEDTQWHWEDRIPRLLDDMLKINNSLQHSTKYVDTKNIISEWLEVEDNAKHLGDIINLIK